MFLFFCLFLSFSKCYLCLLFPEGLLEGSYISKGRCPDVPGLLDLPEGRRKYGALTKFHVFFISVAGPSCTAELAQHNVQKAPDPHTQGTHAQSPQPRDAGLTCSSPLCKVHTLRDCAFWLWKNCHPASKFSDLKSYEQFEKHGSSV